MAFTRVGFPAEFRPCALSNFNVSTLEMATMEGVRIELPCSHLLDRFDLTDSDIDFHSGAFCLAPCRLAGPH